MSCFDSDACHRLVDPTARLRTARLCLNRILEEPNLTGAIRSYYKGILASDCWTRMSTILQQLKEADSVNSSTERLIQEMTGYLEYYFDHTWIMTMSMVVLARSVEVAPSPSDCRHVAV